MLAKPCVRKTAVQSVRMINKIKTSQSHNNCNNIYSAEQHRMLRSLKSPLVGDAGDLFSNPRDASRALTNQRPLSLNASLAA